MKIIITAGDITVMHGASYICWSGLREPSRLSMQRARRYGRPTRQASSSEVNTGLIGSCEENQNGRAVI